MNTALRTQYVPIEKHWDSSDGIMTVEAIARSSGVLKYRTDKGDRFEFVPQEMIDLRDENDRPAMGWLGGAPLTNEHPPQVIRRDAATRKNYQVGKVSEEMHIYNDADGERVVKVRFDVSDPVTQQQIRSGEKTGVSLGYMCKVDSAVGEYKGKAYTHIQSAPFEIDHLAIVANPRNPGAVITRFDSDDVGIAIGEAVLGTAIEVIRVDSGCSCEHSKDDEDDDSVKKKKKKTDIKTDSDAVLITFKQDSHSVDVSTANELWAEGVIDRVRLDGKDFFVSADVAMALNQEGLTRFDGFKSGSGSCGRGWTGPKGQCIRRKLREYTQMDPIKMEKFGPKFASGYRMARPVQNGRALTSGEYGRRRFAAAAAPLALIPVAYAARMAAEKMGIVKPGQSFSRRRDAFGSSSGSCGRGWDSPNPERGDPNGLDDWERSPLGSRTPQRVCT